MKKILLLSLLVITAFTTSRAQIVGGQLADLIDPKRISSIWDDVDLKEIEGSPYLYNYWGNGQIENTTGGIFKDIPLKYDAFNDQVMFKTKKGDSIIVNKEMVKRFTVTAENGGSSATFETFAIDGELRYMQNLYDGKLKLLYRKTKRFRKGKLYNGYNTKRIQDTFIDDHAYFIIDKQGNAQEVRLSRSGLIKAFPKQKSHIKAFLKEKRIKGNNPSEAIQVLKHLEDKV